MKGFVSPKTSLVIEWKIFHNNGNIRSTGVQNCSISSKNLQKNIRKFFIIVVRMQYPPSFQNEFCAIQRWFFGSCLWPWIPRDYRTKLKPNFKGCSWAICSTNYWKFREHLATYVTSIWINFVSTKFVQQDFVTS